MIVAYLAINSGVLAIAAVLSSVDASVGLGVGLFGVLSIIRLRSDELTQREVSYYFASLALGCWAAPGSTRLADPGADGVIVRRSGSGTARGCWGGTRPG